MNPGQSLRRLAAAFMARNLEFLRDTSALGWNLLFPVLMIGGFAVIFSGPGQPLFRIAVVSDAAVSADLHPVLQAPAVQFHHEPDADAAVAKVERHRVDLVLDLRTPPGRYWINDASQKGQVLERLLLAEGTPPQRQAVSGRAVRYVDWVAPGLLGVNMMFSCLFGIGYVIVRYRKNGYLKRLNATPLTAVEFLCAQLLSRLVLIMVITVIMYVGCNLLLDFRMEGSYVDLLLVTLLGAVSMTAMGLLVSARVSSEELAGGLLNLFSWPMMVLSGVFFSLDGAPRAVQLTADLLPLTHLLTAARAIMLDGATLADVAVHLGVLAAMSAMFLLLGAGLFRWTQN